MPSKLDSCMWNLVGPKLCDLRTVNIDSHIWSSKLVYNQKPKQKIPWMLVSVDIIYSTSANCLTITVGLIVILEQLTDNFSNLYLNVAASRSDGNIWRESS